METPPVRPKPDHINYVFAVYDVVNLTPDKKNPNILRPALLCVELTRAEARKVITFHPEADNLRIRRASLKPFNT